MIRQRRFLLLAYMLSGCAALTYEVVWTRLLTQQIGQSVWAISTVLAAYMGGLGAGALAGGAVILQRSQRDALRIYATLEIVIAGFAVFMPLGLQAITPLLAFAYDQGGSGFAAARVFATFVLLAVPTAAMGATFPVASRVILDTTDRPGVTTGALYAANTAGAAIGAALAGFLLVPRFGLQLTSLCAVALNIAAAAIAVRLASIQTVPVSAVAAVGATVGRRSVPRGRQKKAVTPEQINRASIQTPIPVRAALAASALALTGFVALINEVAWTRLMALTIGPTTYAFSAMLVLFIVGLAIGSSLAASLAARIRHPIAALGVILILAGAAALAALPQVDALPLRVASLVRAPDAVFGDVLRTEVAIWARLLLPLAATFGAAFPVALRVAAHGDDDASGVPRLAAILYGANTAGSIAGSIAAGFLLLPAVGVQRTIEAGALLVMAGGVCVLALGRAGRLATVLAGMAVVGVGIIGGRAERWNASLLSAGAYKYAAQIQSPDLESTLRAGSLLYYRDGAAGTVSVRRAAGVLSLAIDGKVDASNAGDMLTQKLLAHLPLLLHAQPRRVAIVGLGSGVTLGAALRHPVERVDTIEISREVVEASRFFEAENHHALADPRSNVIVGDGRTHLLLRSAPYDVIISEPSNPWMAGVASLFTREFFVAARRALTSDGILCQWAHTYDISGSDLRSIAATFASVFPDGTIWLVGAGDILFIASPAGIVERLPTAEKSLTRPGVAADLAEVAVLDAGSVLAMYSGGPADLRAYSSGGAIQTDDRGSLEFSAARGIVGDVEDNAAVLRALTTNDRLPSLVAAARTAPQASTWTNRGRMHLQAEAYDTAYDAFAKALSIQVDDQAAVDGLVHAAAGSGRQQAAIALLTSAAAQAPHAIVMRTGLSRLLAGTGDTSGALGQVVPLIAAFPADPRPAEQAAAVLADAGDADRLRPLADHMRQAWPGRPSGVYFAGTVAFLEGRREEAERVAQEGVRAHPTETRLRILLGASSASLGRREEARAAFESALALSPRDPIPYTNLGLLDLEGGAAEAAIGRFAEALMLDPTSAAATDGLAQALRQTGHLDRAAAVERGRRGSRQR
jgi:spermidine synthase